MLIKLHFKFILDSNCVRYDLLIENFINATFPLSIESTIKLSYLCNNRISSFLNYSTYTGLNLDAVKIFCYVVLFIIQITQIYPKFD